MAQDTVDDGAPTPTPVPTPGDVWTGATPSGDETTHDAVTAALGRLDELTDAPLEHHVTVFDAIHEALQDRLADAED
ncbi:hypothetical protein [Oerskovia enterophila]|uniref:hypothetical protein n=1 Tax=Oerskovia enterophila TaxID=43678 RepID=UPI0037F4CD68